MPAAVVDSPEVQNGPFRLYAILCARAKPSGTCKVRLKSIAKKLGVSARTIQKWKRDLELLGWLQQENPGDKAIANYRIIRNPKERNPVRAANAIKVGIRSATKTPHATKAAHTRCEESCTYNKKEDRTPQGPPTEPDSDASSLATDPDQARQGNSVAARSGAVSPTPRRLNQRTPAKHPDWQAWTRWLVATRRKDAEEVWPWLDKQIDRLKEEHGISLEEAGWMLHRELKKRKETGE